MSIANQAISLKGSSDLVSEFFYYAVNSVLYQRGIYPPEDFEQVRNYGMPLLVSKDKEVKAFIDKVLNQSSSWLLSNDIQKLVIVVLEVATESVKERWSFDIDTNAEQAANGSDKSEKEIRQEISHIIRQITASVTYLPLLENPCKFDILVYTRKDADTPAAWEESGPRLIHNAEFVKLRTFNTKIHKIEPVVAYQVEPM